MATETRLRRPFGIVFDAEENLYVMDSLNNRILKVLR
jgi:sugar lactone lactonase YvrE